MNWFLFHPSYNRKISMVHIRFCNQRLSHWGSRETSKSNLRGNSMTGELQSLWSWDAGFPLKPQRTIGKRCRLCPLQRYLSQCSPQDRIIQEYQENKLCCVASVSDGDCLLVRSGLCSTSCLRVRTGCSFTLDCYVPAGWDLHVGMCLLSYSYNYCSKASNTVRHYFRIMM